MCAPDDRLAAPPPRWTLPVAGPRVRVSGFFLLWLPVGAWMLSTAAGGTRPAASGAVLVGIVVSILVHEGAHAAAAHRLGYDVQWVVLGALAGVTAFLGREDRPLERAAIALAGPAASAALVVSLVLVGLTLPDGSSGRRFVDLFAVLNGLALAANLVPVGGTDGARMVSDLNLHARAQRLVPAPEVDDPGGRD